MDKRHPISGTAEEITLGEVRSAIVVMKHDVYGRQTIPKLQLIY